MNVAYPLIVSSFNFRWYRLIHRLLVSPVPEVRARACNALGNMFRHSGYFYDQFARDRKVDLLLDCVADADGNTQKFACFALGNLLYHDDRFYQAVSRSIPHLLNVVAGSRQDADQHKANAVGALGNMARNSSALDPELALNQAPAVVLELVLGAPAASTAMVALFALGTFAKHRRCRAVLQVRPGLLLSVAPNRNRSSTMAPPPAALLFGWCWSFGGGLEGHATTRSNLWGMFALQRVDAKKKLEGLRGTVHEKYLDRLLRYISKQ